MGAQEGRRHINWAHLSEPSRCRELAPLRRQIEAITRLDLYSGDALGDQRVETRQRAADEVILAGSARCRNSGEDAAARVCNLGISRTFETHLELAGTITGVDEVSMAVDQPGRNPSAAAVDRLAR